MTTSKTNCSAGDIDRVIERLTEDPDDVVVERYFGETSLDPSPILRSVMEGYPAWQVRDLLKTKKVIGIPVHSKIIKRFVSKDGVEFKPNDYE